VIDVEVGGRAEPKQANLHFFAMWKKEEFPDTIKI
jgi:hypothetical protein